MYKQAIVVRKDLEWSKGKLAAQACHAAVEAALKSDKEIIDEWRAGGSKKVILKVESLEDLKKIFESAKRRKLSTALISDAGLTQLPRGTVTALAIGPEKEQEVDKITGKLKLL